MKRIVGTKETDKRIFSYQGDAKRSTAQETIIHKPNDQTDGLTSAHIPKVLAINMNPRSPNRPTASQGGSGLLTKENEMFALQTTPHFDEMRNASDSQRLPQPLQPSSNTTIPTSETTGMQAELFAMGTN